jgi:hypothetical protein
MLDARNLMNRRALLLWEFHHQDDDNDGDDDDDAVFEIAGCLPLGLSCSFCHLL